MLPVDVLYNRLPSPSLRRWVESVSLVERLSGRASTLAVSLCNADGRFLGEWRATKGDSIALSIPPASAEEFAIQKISHSRAPAVVTWEAEGRPATSKALTGRGGGFPPPVRGALVEDKKSWGEPLKNRRLRDVAQRVCDECGLSLKYVAKANPLIPYISRYNETGFHLIDRFCRVNALVVRATSGEVTILSAQARDDKSPPMSVSLLMDGVIGITQSDVVSPRSVRSARLDPRSASTVRLAYGDGEGPDVDLPYDADAAESLYLAAVAECRVATVDVVPVAGITAGSIIDISGVGLREVAEMRYSRTGDAERMSLMVRAL